MIVDDSSVIRKVAKRILAGHGMLVAEAATAHEAIEICTQQMPQIVAVDSLLPDMDSAELIRLLMTLDLLMLAHIALCACQFDIGRIMRAKGLAPRATS